MMVWTRSASYAKDVLWVLNKWGHFYSRKSQSFYEPIGKMRVQTQVAISSAQKLKDGVRKSSSPFTEEHIKILRSRINSNELKEIQKYNWVLISFVFGLRPSECDAVLKNKSIEDLNGVPVVVAIQTKLTVVDESEREKRIGEIRPE